MGTYRTLVGIGLALMLAIGCKKDSTAATAAPPGAAAPAVAMPPQMLQWNTNATQFRGRTGQAIVVMCPPNGTPGSVWGSDVYTDDSSICTAALHSGRVTTQLGGIVSITVLGGQSAYLATSRNGVTTSPYGAWQGSFSIVGGAAPGMVATPVNTAAVPALAGIPANAVPIEWGTQGRSIVRGTETQTVFCRPLGRARSVWGTDVYTSDSSICTAAVHAGVITMLNGGAVQVTAAPGRGGYPPSRRNGVRSQSWGSWGASFTVAAPSGVAPAAPTPAGK